MQFKQTKFYTRCYFELIETEIFRMLPLTCRDFSNNSREKAAYTHTSSHFKVDGRTE